MAHMTSIGASCSDDTCGAATRVVTYTATGLEGVDFMVPIGLALAFDTYEVGLLGIAGAANNPQCDFPNVLAGDRTTTEFRVLTATTLTAGDVLKFLIVEV